MKPIVLFCFPFAGGNKYSYRAFEKLAPSFFELVPLEYPGRGARYNEPLLSDIHRIVDDLYDGMRSRLNERSYLFYGHSMGGLIAYLLTKKIFENNLRPPLHLFVTGTTGPSARSREEKQRHLLDQAEFIEELKKINGRSSELFQNDELFGYFEPILRADFKASETYVYEESSPLNLPITVITGTDEDMEISDIELWQKESCQKVVFERMPGDHFFIYDHIEEIMEIISKNC